MTIQALIFDMDGVIVDSNPFHKKAWQQFCDAHQCNLDDAELEQEVYGKTNRDALHYVFPGLSPKEEARFTEEKEALYQRLFQAELKPVPGLLDFLARAQQAGTPMAVATSALPGNVEFVLDGLNLRRFFDAVVDSSMITHGKPDPEIYLAAAARLNRMPETCLVYEDSLAGVKAGKRAGMTVTGITTTHSREELAPLCDAVIDDFTQADLPH